VENTDVENSAECALETPLRGVDALRPTGASADLLLDGGCEKANTDGKHDELATAAAAKATAIMDALLDDMAGRGGEMWCVLAVLWVFGRLYGDLVYSFMAISVSVSKRFDDEHRRRDDITMHRAGVVEIACLLAYPNRMNESSSSLPQRFVFPSTGIFMTRSTATDCRTRATRGPQKKSNNEKERRETFVTGADINIPSTISSIN